MSKLVDLQVNIDKILLPEEEKILHDKFILRENANIPSKALYVAIILSEHLNYRDMILRLFPYSYKLHSTGLLHLHKLMDKSTHIPYCGSVNALKIALEGLVTTSIRATAPRHVIALSNQLLEGACELSGERTGAVGYSNFIQAFTLVMGRDDLAYDPRIVKQAVEHFIWACNFNNRHLLQSLFINIDFRFDKYQSLERQALIARLILETFLKGDAQGRPFTFPLMTFLHNDVQLKLLEEAGLWDLFWRVVAERGSFYFLAHENAGMNEDDIYSFCCRLHSNRARIIAERGIQNSLAISTGTGSIGYFSINLPRLAYLYGKDWNRFTEELEDVIRIGIYDYLLKLWLRYIYFTKLGLYPFTTWALGEYWYTLYYWTVATVGTAEAVAILLGEPKLWLREVSLDGEEWFDTVLYWYSKLMETISRIVTKIENELNRTLPFDEIIEKFELNLEPEKLKVLINIEQSPAESASGKFAKLDWEQYPEMRKYIPVGKTLDGEVEPFYTSQITPYYTTWRLITQLELEGKIQKYYTGGVNKLIRIHRPLPVESVIELVETCRKLGLIYYTYVPTQNICPKCGYHTIGLYYNCPKCGAEMEIWSRIVGYYRPVRQWNPSKQAEFTTTRGLF